MSKLIVNEIEPFNVGPVNIEGEVEISENLTVNGADGLTSSVFYGDGSGLTNLNLTPFSGNTSGTCIQEMWLNYLNGCDGLLNVVGDVNVSGFVSADTYYGNSSNLTKQINNIIPIGSGSTNVNAYLEYGINLISTATTTNFCVRLPLTPIEGREVIVINNSGFNIYVFPSMAGGSINGVVNGANTVPSDGKRYVFVCYENPNPGQWSSNILAAPGQYDSGVISLDTTSNVGQSFISAVDDNFKNLLAGSATASVYFDGINKPYIIDYFNLSGPNYVNNFSNCIATYTGLTSGSCGVLFFKPTIPWSQVTKITVYTNFTTGATNLGYNQIPLTGATIPGFFQLLQAKGTNYYSAGTTYFLNNGPGDFGFDVQPSWYSYAQDRLSGIPSTIANGYTANPGEPGTYWGELIYDPGQGPSMIGDILLSSGTMYVSGGVEGAGVFDVDLWSTNYLTFQFQTRRTSPLVKIRFLIDYII